VVLDATPRRQGDPSDLRGMTAAEAMQRDRELEGIDWSHIPPDIQRWSIDAPSGRLAGIQAGAPGSLRILLVPGVTGSKEDFLLMLPLLASAGYLVESYDLAGHYDSIDAGPERLDPPRRHYDHDLFVDDLLAVIDHGEGPVHLLGYSFAGTVAQLVAVRHPERIASLTLLSCPPVAGQTFRATKSALGPLSRVVGGRQGAGLMLWGIRQNFNRTPQHRYDFVMARMPRLRRAAIDDVIGLMRRTPDLASELAALRLPKLVAYGAHDLWPAGAHERFARDIGARVVRYDEAGHSPCEETPHQLSRDLLQLIEGTQAEV